MPVSGRIFTIALLSVIQSNNNLAIILEDEDRLTRPRILIIGETGVGKSSLANSLMGRNPRHDGSEFDHGCFKVAWKTQGKVVTTDTCADTGHWLNKSSEILVTVIDTPGVGDEMEAEQRTVNRLVDILKNQIKYVHVFVIAFKQDTNRISNAMLNLLNVFQNTFGKSFWNNAILEATHWNFHPSKAESKG